MKVLIDLDFSCDVETEEDLLACLKVAIEDGAEGIHASAQVHNIELIKDKPIHDHSETTQ